MEQAWGTENRGLQRKLGQAGPRGAEGSCPPAEGNLDLLS